LLWDSAGGSPTFHPDSQNESVSVVLNNPACASSMDVTFTLANAANDWWWAIDNLSIRAGAAPPSIVQQPSNVEVTAGSPATLTVVASGGQPLFYQWFKGQGMSPAPIPGATSSSYIIPQTAPSDAGVYSVEVTNSAGRVVSAEAILAVLLPPPPTVQIVPPRTNVMLTSTTQRRFNLRAPIGP